MPEPFSLDTAPHAPIPKSGERALVIAPHPDDESLGAGGWIFSARQLGAEVRILFLTDGDAFRLAALTSGRRIPGVEAFRALGTQRRKEAITAAAALGIPAEWVGFLGYPDRGLTALRRLWSPAAPYRSRHTGRIAGGEECRSSDRPYCGEALLEDLVAAIRAIRPKYLLFPDANDDHSDHRAAAWFTLEAVRKIGGDQPDWMASYLIHFGLWPLPHRLAVTAPLGPPTRFPSAPWETSLLNGAALRAKAAALRAHSSQHLWASDLFGAHLRTNELFRRLRAGESPARIHR